MNHWDRVNLPWLPPAPDDFRARCKALAARPDAPGLQVRALASYRLNADQIATLSKAIRKLKGDGASFEPLVPITIALVGDGSHELIVDALAGTAARHGIHLSVVEVPFNSGEMMALDAASPLQRARPDVVVLNFTYRAFRHVPDTAFDDRETSQVLIDEAVGRIRAMCHGIRTGCGASVILQTIPRPAATLFGGFDRLLPGTPLSILEGINRGILELARSPNLLLDIAALSESVGLDAWHDQSHWHGFKLPFSQRLVPLYADHVTRTLAAMRGLTRKCLVLDLDNTLWGGVIGDDGIEGIRLGQGLADGEAFLDVQRMAKQLRQRGIILAVSSKNTDAVARQPFRDHPDMILSEPDITVFQANWSDKAQNLEAIARTLEIGLDALVLLDDNPAERELVRQRLPQVGVPELPDDPALYPQTLLASGLFDAVSYSDEDGKRADMYAVRTMVADLKGGSADLGSFLESLEMIITFAPFDARSRSRIAQLINKSNQFNLTTRRYTEADVQSMETAPDVFTLQVRLKDKFIDHGMIGVVICRSPGPGTWEIDTWLMSCRVLGRRVEEAALNEIVERAAEKNVTTLIGRYIASGRNAMVADHYQSLGFQLVEKTDVHSTWTFPVNEFEASSLPMTVCRSVAPGAAAVSGQQRA